MRKHFPTILIYFFLLVFIIQIACLVVLLVIPQPGQAADFTPQVTIPNSGFTQGSAHTLEASTKPIGDYIQAIYNYSIGIVGILATVVLMFGGVMWITAGGNAERVGSAKVWLGAALTGLALALCSYVLLNTVNPDLVNLKVTNIVQTGKIKNCCSEKLGAFGGFMSVVNNQQQYSCTPPQEQKEKYGNTKKCDSNDSECKKINSTTYRCVKCDWKKMLETEKFASNEILEYTAKCGNWPQEIKSSKEIDLEKSKGGLLLYVKDSSYVWACICK